MRNLGTPDATSTVTAAADPSSFTSVASGIASILTPLAQVGVSIYQTKELQKLEKARMKAEAANQAAMAMMMPQQAPVIVQSNTGLLIGVVAGGAVMLGLLVFMLTRKKGDSAIASSISTSSASSPAPAERRIKKIKRVSRPRNHY